MNKKVKGAVAFVALLVGAVVGHAQVSINNVASMLRTTIEVNSLQELKYVAIKELKQVDAKSYTFLINEYAGIPSPEFEGTTSSVGKLSFVDSTTVTGYITDCKGNVTGLKLSWKAGRLCYAFYDGNSYSVATDENGVNLFKIGYRETPDHLYERYETSITYDGSGKLAQIERYAIVAKPTKDGSSNMEEDFRYIRNLKTFEYISENSISIHVSNYFWKIKKKQKDEIMNNWKETYLIEGNTVKLTNGSEYVVDNGNRVISSKQVLPSGKIVNTEYSRDGKGWISKVANKTTSPEGAFISAGETEILYQLKDDNADPKIIKSYKKDSHIKNFDENGKLIYERIGSKCRKLQPDGEMSDWMQIFV